MKITPPEEFIFGMGTAAFQIETAAGHDGGFEGERWKPF